MVDIKTSLTESTSVAPDLDHVAQRVNEICRSATFDLAFRIGELIIKELFADSTALWEKQGVRSCSYRALAARGDLILTASALCRAVGVYALVERLGGRERWRHLSASHFQEVLSIEPELRRTLLTQAEEQQWPVSRLRAEAKPHRRTRDKVSVDVPARPLRRLALQLTNYRAQFSQADLDEMSDESVQHVQDALRHMSGELADLEALLHSRRAVPVPCESDIRELIARAPDSSRAAQK